MVINDGAARLLGDPPNLVTAIERIAAMGPTAIAVKRGEYGSLLWLGGEFFAAPALPLKKLIDPTGAGDTFAGGLIGYLAKVDGGLDKTSLKKGILHGTVMASFTVEAFSFDRLKEVGSEEINERYRQLVHLITV